MRLLTNFVALLLVTLSLGFIPRTMKSSSFRLRKPRIGTSLSTSNGGSGEGDNSDATSKKLNDELREIAKKTSATVGVGKVRFLVMEGGTFMNPCDGSAVGKERSDE
jgi:hypothetical protein